jgi:hypothetical protein
MDVVISENSDIHIFCNCSDIRTKCENSNKHFKKIAMMNSDHLIINISFSKTGKCKSIQKFGRYPINIFQKTIDWWK